MAEKSDLEKRLDAIKEVVPKKGFTLVGVDDFEPPGEELYVIGRYDTKAEAEAAKKIRARRSPKEVMHVYSAEEFARYEED